MKMSYEKNNQKNQNNIYISVENTGREQRAAVLPDKIPLVVVVWRLFEG